MGMWVVVNAGWYNPRIRPFTSRSEEAQSSSVVSIDAPVIHSLPAMGTH